MHRMLETLNYQRPFLPTQSLLSPPISRSTRHVHPNHGNNCSDRRCRLEPQRRIDKPRRHFRLHRRDVRRRRRLGIPLLSHALLRLSRLVGRRPNRVDSAPAAASDFAAARDFDDEMALLSKRLHFQLFVRLLGLEAVGEGN